MAKGYNKRNVKAKVQSIGLSLADFGQVDDAELGRHLRAVIRANESIDVNWESYAKVDKVGIRRFLAEVAASTRDSIA